MPFVNSPNVLPALSAASRNTSKITGLSTPPPLANLWTNPTEPPLLNP